MLMKDFELKMQKCQMDCSLQLHQQKAHLDLALALAIKKEKHRSDIVLLKKTMESHQKLNFTLLQFVSVGQRSIHHITNQHAKGHKFHLTTS